MLICPPGGGALLNGISAIGFRSTPIIGHPNSVSACFKFGPMRLSTFATVSAITGSRRKPAQTIAASDARQPGPSLDDPYPEDGIYFSSYAAGASSDLPGCDRRGVVVAGHTDQVWRAHRSIRMPSCNAFRTPLFAATRRRCRWRRRCRGNDRGRPRPSLLKYPTASVPMRPTLVSIRSRTCVQGGAESHSGNLAR